MLRLAVVVVFSSALSLAAACGHAGSRAEPEAKTNGEPADASPNASLVVDAASSVDAPPTDTPPAYPPPYLIIDVEPDSDGSVITINKGRDDGVDMGWTGHLIDGTGQAVRGGDLTLLNVHQRSTRARIGLPSDVVTRYRAVKMDGP